MKIREAINEVDTLGRAGLLGMAAGMISIAAAVGINTIDDVRVNEKQIVNIPDNIPPIAALSGGLILLSGQRILSASLHRDRKRQAENSR